MHAMEDHMNKLNNAEVSLELCRSVLTQHGQHTASMSLRGMEFYNVDAARVALDILRATRVWGAIAAQAKAHAIQTLEDAIQSPAPYGEV